MTGGKPSFVTEQRGPTFRQTQPRSTFVGRGGVY